ncbi:class I SAM-dependent methyltransferase [Parasphingorhabdus cellanae]|uniref:Class I SAM-dependent methyltransferase n=1 Tax=Parasphingorhabdus cellanae TaxID=2806553 RepID=A0ABX7T316_9SPHN|nr:class I SAM-dependent methyltransferase [Parasphingorhabdus cellanae]QTD55956.1 class I SAM-dependent methyltransferase [Parasphingorhabdus cellanae]
MTKKLIFAGFATALLATAAVPALAEQNEKDGAMHRDAALTAVINHERRKDDKVRDVYRNPAETLAFFQVKPTHTVAEYGPGGGWYTRILLPYISANGKYVAVNGNSDSIDFSSRAREGRSKSWPERFPDVASEWTGVSPDKIAAYESDEVPEELKGKIDRVLIFRSMHGMLNGARSDSELQSLREILADDGMIGIVQHRANADASYAMSKGTKGYLKQDSVVALFELNGFELVDSSEINANPKDTKDYEKGVWTLPPVLTNKDENRAKYQAIGESDRMTLLFKKRP